MKVCPKCKTIIVEPVYHEFCDLKTGPANPEQVVRWHKPEPYVAPKTQGPVKHQVVTPHARPPIRRNASSETGLPSSKDDDSEDGYLAVARKIVEDGDK